MLQRIYSHFLSPRILLAQAKAAARSDGLRAFLVLGGNMEPTLHAGEMALYEELAGFHLSRGDVVAFNHPDHFSGKTVPLRLVGLPGDRVAIKDAQLIVNGQTTPEPYLLANAGISDYSRELESVVVPDTHTFLLGDCRDNSKDSRVIGPVSQSATVGKVRFAHELKDRHARRLVR